MLVYTCFLLLFNVDFKLLQQLQNCERGATGTANTQLTVKTGREQAASKEWINEDKTIGSKCPSVQIYQPDLLVSPAA